MSSFTADREVLPASQYLQEKLQERRARNTRPLRARHTDFGPRSAGGDDDIFLAEADAPARISKPYDSSPLAWRERGSDAGMGSSSGSRRRTLGVRDMDQQLDRLNKQNFALKLELDHRREQTTKLQEQIEVMRDQFDRAERLADEHAELLKINSQLVEELEKRDRAVEEAMDIICDLEEKVSDLEERRSSATRPSTAQADSGYAGTETQEQVPPSSPPGQVTPKTPYVKIVPASQPASAASAKLQGVLSGRSPAKAKREPSIFSQKKPSTRALRSVYHAVTDQLHPVKSFHSLLSKQESRADDASVDEPLNSPRLSVLSESSFPSIYSPKKLTSPDRFPWESSPDNQSSSKPPRVRGHLRQDSLNRVSQWITSGDLSQDTPSKSFHHTQPLADVATVSPSPVPARQVGETHFQSLNNALIAVGSGDATGRLRTSASFHPNAARTDDSEVKKSRPRPTSFAGPMFGEPLLPPTPESASTRMLRNSHSSMADERSLLDTTPQPVKGFDALEPAARSVPRSMRSSFELGSSDRRRTDGRRTKPRAQDESSSDEDDTYDARLNPIAHFGDDYDGYPDGKSILMGTPSRFVKHPKPLADVTFDGYDAPAIMTARSPPRRRRSSVGPSSHSSSKPRLNRLETSPTMFTSLSRMVGNVAPTKASVESIVPSRSIHSTSSGNRTIVPSEEHPLPIPPSPELSRTRPSVPPPSRSRASPSPARAFQSIFRRFSNSQGSDRHEPIPQLPTLTSTPSSAYVNTIPIDQRRPKTSDSGAKNAVVSSSGGTNASIASPGPMPSAYQARRPSLQSRTRTEPPVRSATAVPLEEKEKKTNIFQRSSSVRKTGTTDPDAKYIPPIPPSPAVDSSAQSLTPNHNRTRSRRNSVRDAIPAAARRNWRSGAAA